jgi:hypothetical protein
MVGDAMNYIDPFTHGYLIGAVREANDEADSAAAKLDVANTTIERQSTLLWEQKALIGRLREELAVARAQIAGHAAQVDALVEQHLNDHLLADSGQRFWDGRVKTKLHLVFEAAFDKYLHDSGISNPAAHRDG